MDAARLQLGPGPGLAERSAGRSRAQHRLRGGRPARPDEPAGQGRAPVSPSGWRISEFTYGDLERATSRFANVLQELGLRPGDRIFVLLGAGPEAYVCALGTLKFGAVLTTLPVERAAETPRCLSASEAALLVTSPELYDRFVAPIRPHLSRLRRVLLVAEPDGLDTVLGTMSPRFAVPPTDPGQPAMVHFTAGTMGAVSGVVHPHEAVVAQLASATYALDLQDDDNLEISVSAGRVTHTAYGMIAPLARGVTTVVDLGPPSLPHDERTTLWYAPAALLDRLHKDGLPHLLPPSLRLIVAEGGGLRPETVAGSHATLGHTVHDTWWQTETGAILVSNFAGLDVWPGSIGRPMPGIRAAVVKRSPRGGSSP
ncbi:AMP-binding protein [Actinoplanes sp. NPDC049596]|uniref:AMP-binding protein n=1 Tax=unclassified Actinoplanes TaxID=2626549 RepID=UPI00343130C4